jgi:hypothetical protein
MARVLKKRWLNSLVLLACLLSFANTSFATTVVIPNDEDMIVGARAIVRGRVLSVGSAVDPRDDRIYTYVKLRVREVLKGQITSRRIVLKELGGTVGDRTSIVFGNPRFREGEEVLVYLDTWKDGSLRTYQMFLGKFDIVTDSATGQRMAVRSTPDDNTTVLEATSHGDHQKKTATNRMELRAYREMVRVSLAANMARSQEFDQRAYGGIPVLAEPIEFASLAGSGAVEPQFTLLGNYRFFEPDSGQPVQLWFNPNPPVEPPANLNVNDVIAAGNAWSNVSGSALVINYAGNLNECYTITSTPGINVVFNNCDGRNTPSPGCASILAWGGISMAGWNTRVINGVSFRQIIQGFVSFNPWAYCSFGQSCNMQEIGTHEIGHAIGLGHSQYSDATMYAYAHFDGRCASIRTDDADGIRFIYPGSGGGGGPLTIVTTSLPNGTVNTSYSQTLVASGGTTPYTWSLVAGSGSPPPGLTLASNGTISGTPTTAGTYNFTVEVRDSATSPATAQRAFSITVNPAGTAYDSQFVSQNVPTSLQPGQSFQATIRWLNTGTQAWNGSAGFRLGSQNPPNNTTWGGNAVNLPGYLINPGQTLDVTFTAYAPSTPGTYNFQWQCVQNSQFFGQPSANVVVQVGSSGGGTDDAAFVSQSVPTSLTGGQGANVSVTMRNTGTTTWTAGTYALGSQNPQDNTIWGLNRVNVPSSVAPGAEVTFSFSITAPATAGTYNFQWRMVSASGFFGAVSTNVAITVTSGGGGGPYNAAFVSQSVPGTMTPGALFNVSVTMRNTGTSAWSSIGGYKLMSQNPSGNTTWGLSQILLNKYVGSGSQFTFAFTVTAPSTPGTYNFQWRMYKDGVGFFGQLSTNVEVQVGSSGGTNDAAFVSQSVPSTMTAAQTISVSVTMRNTGTTTWTTSGAYRLGSQNPQDNSTWGLSRVNLPGSVAPATDITFTFNVTAPSTPGTYNFQWRMVQDGVGFFGLASTNVAVTVNGGGGGGGTNDAQFVSQSVPSSLNTGQSTNVSVTMRNSGTTTWTVGTYKLGSVGSSVWGVSEVNLAASVSPGSEVTFSFNITAPSSAGPYNFQWRMLQVGVGYFGAPSTNVSINVTSSTAPLSITTTSVPYGTRGVSYSHQIQATGGTPPYTWSATGLAPGLSIDPSTGLISGVPTAGGTFYFAVTVRDSAGATASRTYKTYIR